MNISQIKEAVDNIVSDLCSRRGLRQVWDDIDDDIQKKIKETWANIIENAKEGLK